MAIKPLNNSHGFSLVEVLIAAGLMVLVASGMIGLVTAMNKEQNNQFRMAALREIKTRFQFLITDQNSWNKTLEEMGGASYTSALADCIKDNTSCAGIPMADVALHDASGAVYFAMPPNGLQSPSWPAASNGFTDKGTQCATFNGNAGAGNDTCPFTYKVVWEPLCATAACRDPLIRVTARLIYNPSTGPSAAISLGSGNIGKPIFSTDDSDPVNTGKYDVVIKRSASQVNKTFTLQVTSTGSTGGGYCWTGANTFSIRGKSTPPEQGQAWTEVDPFELVSTDGSTGIITIVPGTYNCKISSVAWAVDEFSIRLRRITAPAGVLAGSTAAGSAPKQTWVQSTLTSNPTITISGTAPVEFVLEQFCGNRETFSGADVFSFGLPITPYYTSSTFATMSCAQTN